MLTKPDSEIFNHGDLLSGTDACGVSSLFRCGLRSYVDLRPTKKASTAALAVITFPSTNSFELECITAYPVVDNNAIKEWKILA